MDAPKEFTVRRVSDGRYVESIDSYDGDTEWTADPRQARIFRGPAWVLVWDRPEFELVEVEPPSDSLHPQGL